jgi:hypothetical protein
LLFVLGFFAGSCWQKAQMSPDAAARTTSSSAAR